MDGWIEGGMEGGRDGGRDGWREGGREGGKEREAEREGVSVHGAFTLSAAIASAGHRLFLSRRAISLPPSCLPPPGRTASCSAGGDKIVMEARRRSGWTTVSGFLAVVAIGGSVGCRRGVGCTWSVGAAWK